MKILRHFMELVVMALMISILYYVEIDSVLPYILPVTIIGVVSILLFAFILFKNRGWMSVIILLISMVFMTNPTFAAYQKLECGGQHNGKSSAEMILSGSAGGVLSGGLQAAQDELTNGNLFTDEFDNDNIKACVLINIIAIGDELCGQPKDCEGEYDPQMRQNAVYAKENYLRMSSDTVGDDVDNHDWIEDGAASYGEESRVNKEYQRLRADGKDADDVFHCIDDYIEHCACVDKKKEANCRTIAQTVAKNSQECWVCSIVDAVLLASQKIALSAYVLLKDFAIGLLGVMFLFWLAVKVLQLLGTFGYGDHNSFFTELLFRSITVMIAAAILYAPMTELYRIVVSPFIMATAGFTEEISNAVLSDYETDENGEVKATFYDKVKEAAGIVVTSTDPKQNCMQHCTNMLDENFTYTEEQRRLMRGKFASDKVPNPETIDAQSYSALLCLTCRVYNQLVPFTAIGERMTCYAYATAFDAWYLPWPIPNFAYLLLGFAFIVIFTILTMFIAFYIIDIVLKLSFIIVLTPLFVVAWAFPISREYTTKAWNLILYSLWEFIGVAVTVAIIMVLVVHALSSLPGDGDIMGKVVRAMTEDNVVALFGLMGGSGPWTFLKLVVIMLMGIKMITSSGAVVSTLSGISPGITGVAMSTLQGVVQGAISVAGVSVAAAGKAGGKAANKLKGKVAGKLADISKSRNSTKGRFGGNKTTNTRQAASKGINDFSAKSRQAGTSVSGAGERMKERGKQMSNAGREMASKGGFKRTVKGNLMRASGAIQSMAGSMVNPIAKGVGSMMNKAGNAVANVVDKSGAAKALQKSGDAAQHRKEAALRADPAAAAQREAGYKNLSAGFSMIAQGKGNPVEALAKICKGGASVIASKARRGMNQVMRNSKRNGNRKS